MLIRAAVDEYLTYLAVDRARSPQTIRAYTTDLERAMGYWEGLRQPPVDTAALSKDFVRGYQRQLGAAGLALSSRARRLQALRGFLRHALREGWLTEDLATQIDIPKTSAPLPKPLTTADARRLLAFDVSATEPALRDRALIHFLLSTGCRISEALAVDRSHINPGGRLVVKGKGSKERVVHLTPEAMASIRSYMDCRHDKEEALFLNYDPHSRRSGRRRLKTGGARHIVRQVRQASGVEGLRSPHVLRHTTATELLTITGNVRLVQEVLGHSNLNTMQGYTKVVDQARTDAYRELARRLRTGSSATTTGEGT